MKRLTLTSVFLLSILFAITTNVFAETKAWQSTFTWKANDLVGDYTFKDGGSPAVLDSKDNVVGAVTYTSNTYAAPEGIGTVHLSWTGSSSGITMYVSRDNGFTWTQITTNPGSYIVAPSSSYYNFKWKATLSAGSSLINVTAVVITDNYIRKIVWSSSLKNADYNFMDGGATAVTDSSESPFDSQLYTSNIISTAGNLASLRIDWEAKGNVTMQATTDNNTYTDILNGKTNNTVPSGTQLRWKANLGSGATLNKVTVTATENTSPINFNFGEPQLSGFHRKKCILVRNYNSYPKYNYQLLIRVYKNTGAGTVNCNGNVRKGDFSDIRFTNGIKIDATTNQDSGVPLYHYREYFEPTGTYADFYVKIPYLAANTTTPIYMYYDNVDAVSASDPEHTFDFYDDFSYPASALDTKKWVVELGNNYEVHDGFLIIKNEDTRIRSLKKFSCPIIQEVKVRFSTSTNYALTLAGFWQSDYVSSSNKGIHYGIKGGDSASYDKIIANGVAATSNGVPADFLVAKDYIIRIVGKDEFNPADTLSTDKTSEIWALNDDFSSISYSTVSHAVTNEYIALGRPYMTLSTSTPGFYTYSWVRVRQGAAYRDWSKTPSISVDSVLTENSIGERELPFFRGTLVSESGNLQLGLAKGSPAYEYYDPTGPRYFQKVKIINNANEVLSEYPIKIIVPYDAHMQLNFSDVHFQLDDDTNTEISYWLDTSTITSQTAEFWVKIPSPNTIPVNGTFNIKMVYGKTGEAIPQGNQVFSLFDDFTATRDYYDGLVRPTWFPEATYNLIAALTTWSITGNRLVLNPLHDTAGNHGIVLTLKKGGSPLSLTDVSVRIKFDADNFGIAGYVSCPIWARFRWDATSSCQGVYSALGATAESRIGTKSGTTDTKLLSHYNGLPTSGIHELRAYGNWVSAYYNNILVAKGYQTVNSGAGNIALGCKAVTLYIKELIVRKYVYPEPTVSFDASKGIYISPDLSFAIPYNIREITPSWSATSPGTDVSLNVSAYNMTGVLNWTAPVISGTTYHSSWSQPDFTQGKNLSFQADFNSMTGTTLSRMNLTYSMNPVVTAGNIDVVNLTGAQGMSPSGADSIYRAGDKIRVTWNNQNNAAGDNNTYLQSAYCNFSQLNATYPDELMSATGGTYALYQTNGTGFNIPSYAAYPLEDTNWTTGVNKDPSQAKKVKVKAIVNNTLGILTETIDDANLYIDNTPPNITAAKISTVTSPNAYGAYKAGDRLEVKWAHSKSSAPVGDTNWDSEIVSAIIELVNGTTGTNILTNNTALKVVNNGIFGNFSVSSSNPMDYSDVEIKVTAADNANNTNNAATTSANLIIDSKLPVINAAYLNVTTGKSKTYKTGDIITLEWNNNGTAQNSPNDIVNVTANFSAFGDTSGFAAMANSANIYNRSYTIQNGSIDNTGTLNLAIKARDDAGNELQVLTPDNFYIYCDNLPPQVSASNVSIVSTPNGDNSYYKLNGLVRAKWAHYPANADTEIVSAIFELINGTSGAVILTNTTPLKNSNDGFYADFPINANPAVDWNDIDVRVTGTDNAGNTNATTNTNINLSVDNILPVVASANITIPTNINRVYKANDAFSVRWDNNGTAQNNPNDILSAIVNLTSFGGSSAWNMTKTGDVYNYTFNIPNNGTIDNTNLQVFVTARDHAGNENNPVGSPVTYNISCDNKLPVVNNAYITFPTGNKLYRAGEPLTVQWNNTNATAQNNPNDILSAIVNLTSFGGSSALSMVKTGDIYTYTYNIPATGGTIDNLNLTASINATDDAGNTNIPVNSRDLGIGLDNKLPVVTASYINVTSGLNKIYKIGDTLSVSWNNTNATAQNNPNDILEAFANLTAFGGGSNVSMGGSGQVYTSSYIIQNGTIENIGNLQIFVKARDEANNYNVEVGSPIAYNIRCDNFAPRMTSANITLYKADSTLYANNDQVKVGDTITARWAYGATGDNNNDINSSSVFADFSQFGGNSSQLMSLVSNVYQASYVVQNSTAVGRVIDSASLRMTVSAKDDADNPVGPVNDAVSLKCDNQPPKMEFITISPASRPPVYKTGDTIAVTWDSSASGDDNTDLDPGIPPTVDFTQFGGSKVNMSVVSPRIYRASYTIRATDPSGGHDLEVASIDDAGNKSVKIFRLTVMLGYFIDPPAAGSAWSVGTAIPITWTPAGGANATSVTIQYSYDNGATYADLVSGNDITNPYEWVPDHISSQAIVKIIDRTNSTINSTSGTFYTTGNITITSPGVNNYYSDNLSRWPVAKPQTIIWDPRPLGEMTNFAVFVNGIQVGTSNISSFNYTPSLPQNPATIRITDITPGHPLAESSKNVVFSSITVNPPNAATVWQQNSTQRISWTQTGLENARLFYIIGSNVTQITPSVPVSAGGYNWTIPKEARSPNTQVKAVDAVDISAGANFTTALFRVVGRLQLNDPPATLGVNQPYNITWTTPNAPVPRVNLYLINDQNGAIAETITPTPISNTGTYSWTPTQTLPQVKLRICDADFLNNDANAYNQTNVFSISGISVNPLPKQSYVVGEPLTVYWTQSGMQGTTVDISYTYTQPDGTNTTATIMNNVPTGSSGNYLWMDPLTQGVPDTISKNAVIHVKDSIGTASGNSIPFNITGSLTVQTPEGGSVFSVTDQVPVTWNTVGSIPKVNLEYSLNGGSTWQPIKDGSNQDATNIDNMDSFNWTIPNSALSQNAYLRVVDASSLHPSTEGRSGQLQIGAKLSFVSPVVDAKWAIGSTQDINWTVIGDVNRVKLEYATGPDFDFDNEGVTIVNPVVNNGTSGSYPWNVARIIPIPRHEYIDTDANQIQVKLRISDVTPNHLPVPQISPEFTAHYYEVVWNVFNIQSGGPVTNLKVDDTSGWRTTDFTSLSPGDNVHYYPYGQFVTSWSLQDGSLETLSNRTTRINDDGTEEPDVEPVGVSPWTSDRNQRRQVFMEVVSQEAVVWNVRAQSHYEAASQQVQMATWLEKTGSIVTNYLDWAQVEIYAFDDGSLVRTLTNSAADVNGSFRINWDLRDDSGELVPDGKTYFAKVTIQRKGRPFTSAESINIAVPKAVLSNELGNQTSSLQDSLGILLNRTQDIHNDTTAIREETDKIQAIKNQTDMISGIEENVTAIRGDTGNILVATENLTAQIATTQSAIEDRIDSRTGVYEGEPSLREVIENKTAVLAQGIAALPTREEMKNFFNITNSQLSILEAAISTIDGRIESQVMDKLNQIQGQTNTINWGQISGLVTTAGEIKGKTDNINWSDIAEIKTATGNIKWSDIDYIKAKADVFETGLKDMKADIAKLLAEIGTGNIEAIKTATDTIDWNDVTGLVTSTGDVKAKTDVLSSDIVGIKTKTDTINWNEVTGIKSKADTIDLKAEDLSGILGAIQSQNAAMKWGDIEEIKLKLDALESGQREAAVAAQKDNLNVVGEQLAGLSEQVKNMNSVKSPEVDKILEVEKTRASDIVYLKKKTQEIKAMIKLNQDLMDNVAYTPVVHSWLEFQTAEEKAKQEKKK